MKNKYFLPWSTIPLIVSLVLWFIFHQDSTIALLSPLLNQNNPPNLTEKLNKKINTPPNLDYSSSTSVASIPKSVSYLLYSPLTGRVYYANNPTTKIYPASFTKLMTAIVALDTASVNQLISTTTNSITKEPTVLGLKINEQLSVSELIRGSISTSANDAAATLADGISTIYGQNLDYFISLMNQKAKLMNMNNTHFINAEGYHDDNQYSTLEDLYILVHNVQQNYPEIIKAGKADREDLTVTSTHGFYYLPNWNGLLGIYPGVNGLKIAYTEKSAYSTIITSTRNDHSVNLILIGADTLKSRDYFAALLLDFAYQKEKIPPIELTEKDLQKRYDSWNELAQKIKAELSAPKKQPK